MSEFMVSAPSTNNFKNRDFLFVSVVRHRKHYLKFESKKHELPFSF